MNYEKLPIIRKLYSKYKEKDLTSYVFPEDFEEMKFYNWQLKI